jgi:hypothetical protein
LAGAARENSLIPSAFPGRFPQWAAEPSQAASLPNKAAARSSSEISSLLITGMGRIGAHGRMVAERYDSEPLAVVSLLQQAERKMRRGYVIRAGKERDGLGASTASDPKTFRWH